MGCKILQKSYIATRFRRQRGSISAFCQGVSPLFPYKSEQARSCGHACWFGIFPCFYRSFFLEFYWSFFAYFLCKESRSLQRK